MRSWAARQASCTGVPLLCEAPRASVLQGGSAATSYILPTAHEQFITLEAHRRAEAATWMARPPSAGRSASMTAPDLVRRAAAAAAPSSAGSRTGAGQHCRGRPGWYRQGAVQAPVTSSGSIKAICNTPSTPLTHLCVRASAGQGRKRAWPTGAHTMSWSCAVRSSSTPWLPGSGRSFRLPCVQEPAASACAAGYTPRGVRPGRAAVPAPQAGNSAGSLFVASMSSNSATGYGLSL